ncbi:hypothetical protein ACO0K3_17350 [Undibacterium sp. Rencai35W]|uniref:hypothetical protein n=1 Tax=Undibacterium sp. Rencai35W TaxID=3413046 RepID=UPI003BF2F136
MPPPKAVAANADKEAESNLFPREREKRARHSQNLSAGVLQYSGEVLGTKQQTN